MSQALPGLLPALPGAAMLVVGTSSYFEGRQECPPRVWYSPEIDASIFTLHILSDTPGGFQWLKYMLLMSYTWLFLVPLSKEVVGREESKTILWSRKHQLDNVVVWRILSSRHYSFCWGETTLLFLTRHVDTWSRHTWGQSFLRYTYRLLGWYSWVQRESEEEHNSVWVQRIFFIGYSWMCAPVYW
jgi:hypothetical protein